MNYDEAIAHYEGLQKRYTTQHNGKHCRLVATALSALREAAERANPNPLTMEELKQMDGEPVYMQFGTGEQCWVIVSREPDWIRIDSPDLPSDECPDEDFCNMEYNDPAGHFGLHALGWRAYRNKPKEAADD